MLLCLAMLLTGCATSSKPVNRDVSAFTQECPYPATPSAPWTNKVLSELVKRYHTALKDCNADKASLRSLLSDE